MASSSIDVAFQRFESLAKGDTLAAAMLVLASAIGLDGDHETEGEPSFLSVKRVAARLGVSETTVRELVNCGKLPAARIGKGRGTLRFDPALVDAYCKSTSGSAPAPCQMPARRFVR